MELTPNQLALITEVNAVAKAIDSRLRCTVNGNIGTLDAGDYYVEFNITAFLAGSCEPLCTAQAPTKADALVVLTSKLKFWQQQQLKPCSRVLKEEICGLLKHSLLTRTEVTTALLNINRYTEAQAVAKVAELRARIEEREGLRENTGVYGVVGEAFFVEPVTAT